jgi:hypothetical protein
MHYIIGAHKDDAAYTEIALTPATLMEAFGRHHYVVLPLIGCHMGGEELLNKAPEAVVVVITQLTHEDASVRDGWGFNWNFRGTVPMFGEVRGYIRFVADAPESIDGWVELDRK